MAWYFPKSLAKSRLTCGYIYEDGIVLLEEREVKSGKYRSTMKIAHIWETSLPIHISDNGENPQHGIKLHRIVVHHPEMLRDGLNDIRIGINDWTQSSRERGITFNVVTYKTPAGAEHSENQFSFLSRDLEVQFANIVNPIDTFGGAWGTGTVKTWMEHTEYIIENHEA